MSGVTSSGGTLPAFITEIKQVADEVVQGKWDTRKDDLSDRIGELIHGRQGFLSDTSQDAKAQEAFTSSVLKLVDALNDMDSKTEKVAQTIQKLSGIIQGEKEVDMSDLKHLPSSNDLEIQKSVLTFRSLIAQGKPNAKKSFAEWIDFNGVRVSQLKLSKEELLEIAPHLKVLNFDAGNFSESEVHEIISKCQNLTTLILQTDSITKTPPLPEGLQIFTLKFSNKLDEVPSLNEGLREFKCISNEDLVKLPAALPKSLVAFTCIDNRYLRALPAFNEGLKSANVSNGRFYEVPALPKSLESLNMSQCDSVEKLGSLPSDSRLKDLDTSRCASLKNIPFPLPKGMKTLKISWCPALVLPENFETEKPSALKVIK